MPLKLIFFICCLTISVWAQETDKKEYIQLKNGEVLQAEIKKLRPTYVVARVGPVERKYPAALVKKLYSKYYNKDFESHAVGKRKTPHLLGVFIDGEVKALVELKNMVVRVNDYNPMMYSSGGFFYGGSSSHTEKSGFWTLEGKTYFRHKSENDTVCHVAEKKAFFNCKEYECFPIMIKLLNGLNDLDLSRNIRDQTYRDLIVKYNNECEARFRIKEEEQENKEKNK